jgi:hypothetical protein
MTIRRYRSRCNNSPPLCSSLKKPVSSVNAKSRSTNLFPGSMRTLRATFLTWSSALSAELLKNVTAERSKARSSIPPSTSSLSALWSSADVVASTSPETDTRAYLPVFVLLMSIVSQSLAGSRRRHCRPRLSHAQDSKTIDTQPRSFQTKQFQLLRAW